MSKGAFIKIVLFDVLALDHRNKMYDDFYFEDDIADAGRLHPWALIPGMHREEQKLCFPLEDRMTCCSVCSQFCLCNLPGHIQALSPKTLINQPIMCTHEKGALRGL